METRKGRLSGTLTGTEKDDLFEILLEIADSLKKIAGHLETYEKEREERVSAVTEPVATFVEKLRNL